MKVRSTKKTYTHLSKDKTDQAKKTNRRNRMKNTYGHSSKYETLRGVEYMSQDFFYFLENG